MVGVRHDIDKVAHNTNLKMEDCFTKPVLSEVEVFAMTTVLTLAPLRMALGHKNTCHREGAKRLRRSSIVYLGINLKRLARANLFHWASPWKLLPLVQFHLFLKLIFIL